VLDSLNSSDPLRQYVEQIHEANERASSLTRQLLAFGRNQETTRELLDLNMVLAGMDAMLRRLMGEQIETVIALSEEAGWVRANRGQLEQIILDLAVNARETMPQGGRLTLETRNVELDEAFVHWHPGARSGSYVMLAVLDTGSGIDPEAREHIFEPFSARQKGKKGGLGLASVYGIVKQNGGYVWVDSEPGLGSRFAIYLPLVRQPVGMVPL
jgi:two-component system cell cycle sensor histidine kinase/response regulator CckA